MTRWLLPMTALLVTGCQVRTSGQVQFGSPSPRAAKASDPSPAGEAASPVVDTSANATGLAAQVLAAYRNGDFRTLVDDDAHGGTPAPCSIGKTFANLAGVQTYKAPRKYKDEYPGMNTYLPNPRSFMQNPDPEWLPGWDRLPVEEQQVRSKIVYCAIAVAAAERTWMNECAAKVTARYQAQKDESDRMTASIAAAKALPNSYARLDALLKLRTPPQERREHSAGAPFLAELGVYEGFRDAGRGFLLEAEQYGVQHDDGWRALLPLEVERDLTCAAGFPYERELTHQVAGIVKPPVSPERAHAAHDALEAARQQARSQLAAAKPPLTNMAMRANAGYTTFHEVAVTRVRADGNDTVVDLGRHTEETEDIGCVETNRVDRVDENGRIIYRVRCSGTGKRIHDLAYTVRLHEMPPDLTIQPGDRLSFYGKVVKQNDVTLVDTPALKKVRHEVEFDVQHLQSVVRGATCKISYATNCDSLEGGTTVAYFFKAAPR